MNFVQAVILGIVEGITEFLPISSTAHLDLTIELLKIPRTEFVKSFEIFIQLGAIASVVVLYWKRLIKDFDMSKKVLVGFVPTAIIGFGLYDIVKTHLLGNVWVIVTALFLGGIAMIAIEKLYNNVDEPQTEEKTITYARAIGIGIIQSISMIPGTSRSAASILGGMILGISRKQAVEFSFLLAIPTMAAATGLDLIKSEAAFTRQEVGILAIGFVVSFVVALATIKWLLNFVQHATFIPFGIYRIVLALVVLLFLL